MRGDATQLIGRGRGRWCCARGGLREQQRFNGDQVTGQRLVEQQRVVQWLWWRRECREQPGGRASRGGVQVEHQRRAGADGRGETKPISLCDKAANGNAAGAEKVAKEFCMDVANSLPAAVKAQAQAACAKV